VGAAVASSTLTTVVGFGALLAANHHGLQSLGVITCLGLVTTLFTSFTLLGAVLQLMHDRRVRVAKERAATSPAGGPGSTPAEAT
jgi:predicted RND superfamily exporter protein